MAFPTLLIAAAAAAQTMSGPTGGPVDQIKSCRALTDSSTRLACYDRAAAELDTAISQRDITILDKQEVRRTRRSLFGFALPDLKVLGIGDKDDDKSPEFTELDTKVVSVRSVSYGKYAIGTTEGAVWQNTDLLDDAPTVGEAMHLKRGAIGSYFLKLGSDRTVKAMRVR